jgi:hypothetical protein
MQTSEQIHEIAAAGAKAQAELRPALKDATNPAFRSKYADLAAVMDAARVYARHGIAVWQDVQVTDAGVAVLTRLTHTSGQWIECGPFVVPVGKKDAHGVGSAASYAKRYAICAALGIAADEDEDGNAAAARTTAAAKPVDPPVAPAGFAEWADGLSAAAKLGTAALKQHWKAGSAALRTHLEATKPGELDLLKRVAANAEAAA